MNAFFAGFGAVPRAADLLLRTPRLRKLAVGPTLLWIVLLLAAIAGAFLGGPRLLDLLWQVQPGAAGWQGWLLAGAHWLAGLAMAFLLLLVGGAVLFFGCALLAEPFIDPLSEGAEQALGAAAPVESKGLKALPREVWLILRDVALDLSLFALAQIVVWLLPLVPVIGGPLHFVVGWGVNAWFAGLEMVTGPMVRRGHRGLARWRALRPARVRVLGLGAAIVLVLLVPLAGLFTLPLAVVAGAVAVVDMQRAGELPKDERAAG